MKPEIPGRRHAHGLDAPRLDSVGDVVRHLGAVQAQLHDMALWAVGRRIRGGTTASAVQRELDAGVALRTHVLRPTWHFVDPTDLAWMQALTGPRVARLMAGQDAELGIDAALVARCHTIVTAALADGPLTRPQLAAHLAAHGVDGPGRRIAHLMAYLEIGGHVASGPLVGKNHTYVALPPAPAPPPRDDMLAELARRYGRGHGSFRARDLAWWSSLTLTDARRAIELAGMPVETVAGEPYAVPQAPVDGDPPLAALLPNYDEYISYARDPADFSAFDGTVQDVLRGAGLLFVDGRLAGRWSRSLATRTVDVEVVCSRRLTRRLTAAIEAEAENYGAFVERGVRLTVAP